MRICIDAGHGGADPGAVGTQPFRLVEKTVVLALAQLLDTTLLSRRHHVVMTRRLDRTLGLTARAQFANRLAADICVSIHANAAPARDAEGIETYYFPGSEAGRRLARAVQTALVAMFPSHRDRGVKPRDLAVLRLTKMPAILVECEFLTNPRQLRFLAGRSNRRLLAQAIAVGIDRFASGSKPGVRSPRIKRT